MKLSTIALLLTILLIGCSGGEPKQATNQATKPNQAKESNTKEKNKSAANSESTLEIQFKRQVTYGTTGEVILGEIATFAVGGRNRVFIADEDQATIHVFNPDGSYLTSLGRQGKGPGEFAAVLVGKLSAMPNRQSTTDYG